MKFILKQVTILTYLGSSSGSVLYTVWKWEMDDLELKTGKALFRVHPTD